MRKPNGYTLLFVLTIIATIGVAILFVAALVLPALINNMGEAPEGMQMAAGFLWVAVFIALIMTILNWVGLSGIKNGSTGWAIYFIVIGIIGVIGAVVDFNFISIVVSGLYVLGGFQAYNDLKAY